MPNVSGSQRQQVCLVCLRVESVRISKLNKIGALMEKPNAPLVYVEWVDAVAQSGWRANKSKSNKLDKCQAAGFLVKETRTYITIAAATGEKESNARITIPKAWIKNRCKLKRFRQ